MVTRATSAGSRGTALTTHHAKYCVTLILVDFLYLFFFCMLIVGSAHARFRVRGNFSLLPNGSLVAGLGGILGSTGVPILANIQGDLVISTYSTTLDICFSTLATCNVCTCGFQFGGTTFTVVLLVVAVPARISTLNFLRLVAGVNLGGSFLPLVVPDVTTPTIFFFVGRCLSTDLPVRVIRTTHVSKTKRFCAFGGVILPVVGPTLTIRTVFTFISD